ncbi:hypothetical protein KBA41_17215, partial [Candidatus Ozemobacteraceae bacterium]|nr:hypothetical protein [Candidatus Ozemobacteraceae bacterium]
MAEASTGTLIGTVTATVAEGHMLYRGQLSVSSTGGGVELHLPAGHRKKDPFGPGEIEIFDAGSWPFGVRLGRITASAEASIELGYQGCSTLTCFMPETWTFTWPVPDELHNASASKAPTPVGTPATNTPPAGTEPAQALGTVSTPGGSMDFGLTIRERGLPFAMLMAFFGGLLVSLTPCVYPMIPITLSIIGSRDENRTIGRGFLLSVFYVAGLSLTYALLGLAVASFGAHLRGFIQGAWFQGAMAVIFA